MTRRVWNEETRDRQRARAMWKQDSKHDPNACCRHSTSCLIRRSSDMDRASDSRWPGY